MTKLNTNLSNQPLIFIVAVQLKNMLATPNMSAALIVRHISNLELTYGPSQVESVIHEVFPNFAKKYYNVIEHKTNKIKGVK